MRTLSILILALVVLAGCQLTAPTAELVAALEADRTALVESREQLVEESERLAARLDTLSAAATADLETLSASRAAVDAARARLDSATPEERSEAADDLERAVVALAAAEAAAELSERARDEEAASALVRVQELAGEFGATESGIAALTEQIARAETEDLRRQADAAAAPFLGFVPPAYRGGALALLSLLPWFASKRSRQHFRKAVLDLNPLDGDFAPGQALEAIARALGLSHSSEDPRELLAVLERKVEANGLAFAVDSSGGPRVTDAPSDGSA